MDVGGALRRGWHEFCDLDGMFPSRAWARAYLLGLGGYWGFYALGVLSTLGWPAAVAVPIFLAMFGCAAIPIGLWIRWVSLHRGNDKRLLIAFAAGLNFPSQFAGAFRLGDWDWRKGTPALLALLLADLILLSVLIAPGG